MKIAKFISVLSGLLLLGMSLQAAPIESVESSRATALAKVDCFLAEKVVASQLAKRGVSAAQVQARLHRLSDAELEQLSAQLDLIQSAGTIQGSGNVWPANCFFKTLETFFSNIFRILFCWPDLK